MAEALRRAEADSGGSGLLARGRLAPDHQRAVVAVPQPRARGRRAAAVPRRATSRPPSWAATWSGSPSPGPRPRSRPASSTWSRSAAARPAAPGRACGPRASSPTGRCRATTCPSPTASASTGRSSASSRASGACGSRFTSTRCSRWRCGPGSASASTSTVDGSGASGRPSRRWRPPTPRRGSSARFTAEELIEPTAENRMISFPYTKRLCSNNQVDQGSGLHPLLGRGGRAGRRAPRPLGVPPRRQPRPSTTGTSRTGPTCARRPPCAWPDATRSPSPGSAPTTSPTPTSTPASPPPCRSRRSSSGWSPTRGRRHRVGRRSGPRCRSRSPAG